jgi:hypothetical protein
VFYYTCFTTGVFDDPRVPENLVNGVNDTTDDQYMWLIPYTPGGKHELRIDLGSMCKLSGISIWNYNKSSDDALRGARAVAVLSDGVLIGKMELRIAPGCDGVAYRQHCCFRDIKSNEMRQKMETLRYVAPSLRQDYETPCNVSGMLWKIGVYSNWGDGYYVGLDGFEFFDGDGHVLNILEMGSITCRYVVVVRTHLYIITHIIINHIVPADTVRICGTLILERAIPENQETWGCQIKAVRRGSPHCPSPSQERSNYLAFPACNPRNITKNLL